MFVMLDKKTSPIIMLNFKTIMVFILIVLTMSCHRSKPESDKPVITVSILPQKYFVEKITGDKYAINVMVPPGASHENYDPTPQQIVDLSKTILYFRIGNIDFENTWISKFTENYPNLKFINLSNGLDLIANHEDDHHHGQTEPHTWMSPANVKGIAKNIFETMVEIDNKNEKFYNDNYQHFLQEIDSLDKMIENRLKDKKSNSFIIYHPALTYYARDYGLNQLALEVDGKNPSVYHIRSIIDLALKENIKAVLVQKQFDKSKAELIVQEIGGKVIEIDPLNENWSQELTEITIKLSEALNN
jgi:zinc transport system substrate-binding protein